MTRKLFELSHFAMYPAILASIVVIIWFMSCNYFGIVNIANLSTTNADSQAKSYLESVSVNMSATDRTNNSDNFHDNITTKKCVMPLCPPGRLCIQVCPPENGVS
jgi:hypothetical protein